MNLSRVALAINQLCHELAPPPGAEPPTPWGGFYHVYYGEGFQEPVRLYGGAPGGPSPKLLQGWWAKIGGHPPTFWPHTITLERLREAYPDFGVSRMTRYEVWRYFNLVDCTGPDNIWFDEVTPL